MNLLQTNRLFYFPGKRSFSLFLLPLFLVGLLGNRGLSAENPDVQGGASKDLISLNLEELMQMEVTSVSKAPEKRFQAPAAIYVLMGEDIRRSGVTSIPEALRLVPGVEVSRVNSSQWSVGVRGFGSRLARYT